MIDFDSVTNVVHRISDIERKIGLRRPEGGSASFQNYLDSELKKTQPSHETPPRADKAADVTQSAQAMPHTAAAEKVSPALFPESGKNSDANGSVSAFNNEILTDKFSEDVSPISEDLSRSEYADVIIDSAKRHGVDPKLALAVAKAESDFDQSVISDVGAVGVMQLMPETAAELGVNPYDAVQNIDGGTRCLKQLLNEFDGDERKAVAAYNAGPGAVHRYGGVPPYAETMAYVHSVLDVYR